MEWSVTETEDDSEDKPTLDGFHVVLAVMVLWVMLDLPGVHVTVFRAIVYVVTGTVALFGVVGWVAVQVIRRGIESGAIRERLDSGL